MIASTAPLVDNLLLAYDAAGNDLHPMIVTGAGTTIAACRGLDNASVSSWSGLIATALDDAAKNDRAKSLFGEAAIIADVKRCGDAKSAEELLNLCDRTRDIYRDAKLDLSQWIYDKLTALEKDLKTEIKERGQTPPLLSAVRDWQASFGAVVATTNYDRLLAIAGCENPIELYEAPLAEEAETSLADVLAGAHNVIHLHGRYDRDGSAVFSRDQYERLMLVNIEANSFARRLFNATLPIFVGCGAGLADDDLRLLIGDRSTGPAEPLKRAIILHREGDAQIAEMMKAAPFDTRCVAIAFGSDHGDLAPFLEQARLELIARGFRGRRPQRGSLRAESWLNQRHKHQADVGTHVPVPPLELDRSIRDLPMREFHGTLLAPRVPTYELQAIDPAIEVPEAGAALHEDARFDPVPLDTLSHEPFAVLLGDGGSGKTALTRFLIAEAVANAPKVVAAHLRVVDYVRSHEKFLNGSGGASDLWQFLLEALSTPMTGHPSPPPIDDVGRAAMAAAERGEILIVLDGLDEVSRLSDRAGIVAEALRLHDRLTAARRADAGLRRNRLILTSRFSGYRTAPILHPSARHLVLCPLLPMQVDRLHDGFFKELIAAGAAERDALQASRRALQNELAASPLGATCWIDTPLLAVLVAAAFLNDGDLPKTREALFDKIVNHGCSFVLDRAPTVSTAISSRDLRNVLQEAAFRIFSIGVQDALSRTSLEDALRLFRPNADEQEIAALVRIVTSDESLLRERGADHFAFVHRGVLEYLCGCRLQADPQAVADKSRDSAWRQPASFAAGMALRTARREKLTAAIIDASSIANGYRPLLCLLRGALYAMRLPRAARQAVAETTIAVTADLAAHISTIEEHRSFRALLRAISDQPLLLGTFEDCLISHFGMGAADTATSAGALLICEGLKTASSRLIVAIDAAASGSEMFPVAMGERVQRLLLRRHIEASGGGETTPLLPFGAVIDAMRTPLTGDRLATWRRGIAAIAGGIADFGHADLRPVRMSLVKLLAVPDERRNRLLFTLPEQLRELSLAQQDAVARSRLDGPCRMRSLQDVMRELRRSPDLILGFAYYLDNIAEPLLNDTSRPATLDGRHVYRTPMLASQIEAGLAGGMAVEDFVRARDFPAAVTQERAILAAIAGQPTGQGAGPALALAIKRVADGAVRSLHAVEASLSSHGGIELIDQGHILADAVVDLKLALNMPTRFDIRSKTQTQSYQQRNLRENVARTITGEGLNPADDIYNAMVIVDVLDAQTRVGALVDLGHSRIIGRGHAAWDLPPLPLPHMHTMEAAILGDAIDNLEVVPPAISAFRNDTLQGLKKVDHPDAAATHLEFDAALAQDWGAQLVVDEASRFEADIWEDRGLNALAAARAAKPSLSKARALSRLLRLASADQLEACEQEIAGVIEQLTDPYEQVLCYEHLAERAHPARGQAFALLAFDKLMAKCPFPPPFFARKIPASLRHPEAAARAYARLSVWLPRHQREAALVAASGLAGRLVDPWAKTVLLHALAPYVRHSRRAQKIWDKLVAGLPEFIRAHCAGDSGAVLSHLVDWMLSDVPELANGEADPIVAFGLLRDARRRLGHDLISWEVLERAECTTAGAQKVREAFTSAEVPRMSAAGLLSLRAFCEAGMSDVATFVLSRVPRHPPGSAALIAKANPELAFLIRAVARGMDATAAPAVAAAVLGNDEACRALALAILEPTAMATFEKEEDKRFAPFTRRRATVEGIDTIFVFARKMLEAGRKGGPMTHAHRYVEQIMFETPGQAERLITAARSGQDAAAARWILGRADLATPQFIKHLVGLTDPDEEIAPIVLAFVAQTLFRAGVVGRYLDKNGAIAEVWTWLRRRPQLKRLLYAQDPNRAALFLKATLRLDPEDFDLAYIAHCAYPLARRASVGPALAAWGITFASIDRPETDTTYQAAGIVAAEDQRTLAALVGYCAWDARTLPSREKWNGLGFRSMAWPILATCVEHCPATLQSRMYGEAMFEDLPSVARNAPSWVTRRSAFHLMPIEWHGRLARVSFDVIEAALAACDDVWQVQEAALAMVATIRSLDNSALDLLYSEAHRGGVRTLMAFRMINAILNNDRAPTSLRQHAQSLIKQALTEGLGDRLIEHGIATTTAPPRMKLRDVLLQQIFVDA